MASLSEAPTRWVDSPFLRPNTSATSTRCPSPREASDGGVEGNMEKALGVPVIDFGKLSEELAQVASGEVKRADAEELAKLTIACQEVGFMQMINHDISLDTIRSVFESSKTFFSLPSEEKLSIDMQETSGNRNRGYFRSLSESLDQFTEKKHRKQDAKEGFDVGKALPSGSDSSPSKWHCGNLWPVEQAAPCFNETVESYLHQMIDFARKVTKVFATVLEVPEDEFLRLFDNPACTLRLLHYPPVSESAVQAATVSRAGAHTDYGCCTFLQQDSVGGLQVLDREGEWVDVLPIEGAFIINIGDMLSAWTGGKFKSTVHRVCVTKSGVHRYSIPFFWNPSPHVKIVPLVCENRQAQGHCDVDCIGKTVDHYLSTRYSNAFAAPTERPNEPSTQGNVLGA